MYGRFSDSLDHAKSATPRVTMVPDFIVTKSAIATVWGSLEKSANRVGGCGKLVNMGQSSDAELRV